MCRSQSGYNEPSCCPFKKKKVHHNITTLWYVGIEAIKCSRRCRGLNGDFITIPVTVNLLLLWNRLWSWSTSSFSYMTWCSLTFHEFFCSVDLYILCKKWGISFLEYRGTSFLNLAILMLWWLLSRCFAIVLHLYVYGSFVHISIYILLYIFLYTHYYVLYYLLYTYMHTWVLIYLTWWLYFLSLVWGSKRHSWYPT